MAFFHELDDLIVCANFLGFHSLTIEQALDLDPEQQQALGRQFRENSIPSNTGFTRGLQDIVVVKEHFLPEKNKKIAFVGCSTGEEVYAFRMLCWDREDHLHGYDINPENVLAASHGIYPFSTLMYMYIGHLEGKAFGVRQTSIVMSERAREKVFFRAWDITQHTLPGDYDVLFLRNILCHYSPKGRDMILRNVYSSLTPSGYLVCESETGKEEYAKFMADLTCLGFKRLDLGKRKIYQKAHLISISAEN